MTTLEPVAPSVWEKETHPRMTWNEAINGFEWVDDYAKKDGENGYGKPIEDFCERTKETLGLDSKEVLEELKNAMDLSTEVFEDFYPDDKVNRKLPYHNATHAKITAAVGTQLFLGALEEMAKNPEFAKRFKDDPKLVSRLIKTAIYSFALHEYKDWWTAYVEEDEENGRKLTDDEKALRRAEWNKRIKRIDQKILDVLVEKDINAHDVGIILELDAFGKTLDESVEATKNDGFEPEFLLGNVGGEMSFTKDLKKTNEESVRVAKGFDEVVKRSFGASLRTADFAQTFNPNYIKRINLVDDLGNAVGDKPTYLGPLVLAHEFRWRRNNAMPEEWATKDENKKIIEMHLENVGISQRFWNVFTKPNVMYGIEFMRNVNTRQYEGMKKAMEEIEASFRVENN